MSSPYPEPFRMAAPLALGLPWGKLKLFSKHVFFYYYFCRNDFPAGGGWWWLPGPPPCVFWEGQRP